MALEDNSFPEGEGTGLDSTSADWDDPGQIAHALYDINSTDYVVTGLTFNYDPTTNTLNISEGVARLSWSETQTDDHTDEGGVAPYPLKLAAMVCQFSSSGDIALTDNATTHVFAWKDLSDNNRNLYATNTDNVPPAEPWLKIGTVDTGTDTVTELNRKPPGQFRRVEVTRDQ